MAQLRLRLVALVCTAIVLLDQVQRGECQDKETFRRRSCGAKLMFRFLIVLLAAQALQCYSCSSLQDANCWNVSLLGEHNKQSCEDLYYACTTRVTTMDDFSFIGRNCLPKGICENTINIDGEIEDRCVTCDTDFCNTGSGASGARGGISGSVAWSVAVVSAAAVVALVTVNCSSGTWQWVIITDDDNAFVVIV